MLRSGNAVCGTLISEAGINLTVQTSAGVQVILRRDQIVRRQAETCEATPASAPAPAVAAGRPPATAQTAASQPAAQQAGMRELRFAGSPTLGLRLVPDLVDAYLGGADLRLKGWAAGQGPLQRVEEGVAQDGNGVRATVEAAGTASVFAALGEQRVDFGMAVRAPSTDEAAQVQRAIGVDVLSAAHQHVLAMDGVAIIVHPGNPVQKLTLEQVRGIFSGAITNWSQVGGPNRPITVYAGGESIAATNAMIESEVLRGKPIVRTAERLPSLPEISTAVASEPGGIGYVGMSYVGGSHAVTLVASCGLEFEANEFSVGTEDYPLARRLLLLSRQPGTNPAADEFLRWVTSPAAVDTTREAGYVPVQPVLAGREYTLFRMADAARAAPGAPDARYSEAMSQYALAVRNAQRLSTTFRFDRNSTQLDVRSQQDIERTAEFLRRPENQRYRVNVLGFTDNGGAFGQNRMLSEQRANEVAQRLRDRGVNVSMVKGFAHVAPVACDEDQNAPVKNRRVEVWLSPG